MRYISIDEAKPGMILARHIWGPHGQLLLTANTTLKETYIKRLNEFRFSALYVKSYPDEPIENLVGPVKQETLVHARETLKAVTESVIASNRIDFAIVRETVEDIVDQVLSNPNVVYSMADIKAFDDYTYGHSVDVCVLSILCGAHMGMNRYELVDLGSGAMLHDVGKLFTPKEILAKPEPLNADEMEVIHRHPWDGFQVLRKHMPLIPAHVAFQHHERYDGSGYPRGLLDADTLDLAKVVAVADSYEAMTSDRPYREAMMPHQALAELTRDAGKSYNPTVIKCFVEVVAAYPLGTVVRLSDGSLATVVGVTKEIYDVQIVSGQSKGKTISIQRDSNDISIVERLQ
jgi:HD-GYP domain-containing protein (c-di-GMP phosphodiesterase class II)